jgi:hypothetical protein
VRSTDCVLAAFGLSLAVGLAAAAGPATLEVVVPDGPVRVGDRVPVRVTARGGDDLLWGELRVAIEPDGAWAVIEPPREVEGARPPVWELVLAPLEIDELALPVITATVRNADGVAGEITADGQATVEVGSVLPEGDEVEPVPLRDPIGVSGFPWEWVVPLMVPLLAAAAGFAWWGRRRRAAGFQGEVPALSPLAEIEGLLDRLGERLGREPAEGICDRLAAGVRRYLERQSDQPAEDMTSFELRLMARRLGWSENVRRGLQDVMAVADSVRFGRIPADETRLRRAVDSARNVARELDTQLTTARAEAEEAAEAAG